MSRSSRRSALVSALHDMEMDPTRQDAWLDGVLRVHGQLASSSSRSPSSSSSPVSLLDVFRREKKEQRGGFTHAPIAPDSFNTVVAPPQSGKSQAIMVAALEAAYDSRILTVMGVMNSVLEAPRFRQTAEKLNGVVARIARALGVSPEHTPRLRVFDEALSASYLASLSAWAAGGEGSNVIPVFLFMMNGPKVDKFRRRYLPSIVRAVGRDPRGRSNVMLLVDEADLQAKTERGTSCLEKSMRGLPGEFTTVTNVTATPQAIVSGDIDFGGRAPVVFEPEPSSTNFQFHTKPGWRNRLITRAEARSSDRMFDDIMKDDAGDRFALLYESTSSTISCRSTKARDTARRFSKTPGVVTFAWSSGKIEIFTSDPYWVRILRDGGVFAEDGPPAGVGLRCFTGVRSVRSYPDAIHHIAGRVADSKCKSRCKFILFAKEMTGRAIPVRGTCHEHPLTDMWIEGPDMTQEARVQVCGRLCGIDPAGRTKTLWCSKEEHGAHMKAIDTVQFVIDRLLSKGIGALEAIAKTKKTLVDLTVDDDGGGGGAPKETTIVVDEEGAVTHLGVPRISRPGAGKRVREAAVDAKREAKTKRAEIAEKDNPFVSGLVHGRCVADGDGSAIDEEGARRQHVEPIPLLVDPGIPTQMREAAEGESGLRVVAAIKECIRENGGSVAFGRLAPDMASRGVYPDGTQFFPSAFLRFIVCHRMNLLTENGIRYRAGVPIHNGSFSEVL